MSHDVGSCCVLSRPSSLSFFVWAFALRVSLFLSTSVRYPLFVIYIPLVLSCIAFCLHLTDVLLRSLIFPWTWWVSALCLGFGLDLWSYRFFPFKPLPQATRVRDLVAKTRRDASILQSRNQCLYYIHSSHCSTFIERP